MAATEDIRREMAAADTVHIELVNPTVRQAVASANTLTAAIAHPNRQTAVGALQGLFAALRTTAAGIPAHAIAHDANRATAMYFNAAGQSSNPDALRSIEHSAATEGAAERLATHQAAAIQAIDRAEQIMLETLREQLGYISVLGVNAAQEVSNAARCSAAAVADSQEYQRTLMSL